MSPITPWSKKLNLKNLLRKIFFLLLQRKNGLKIHSQYWERLCRLEGLTGLDEIDFQRHVVYDRTAVGASRHIKMIVRLGFFLTSRIILEKWALLHDHFHQACDSHELYKLVLPCISRSRCSDVATLVVVAHIPWFFVVVGVKKTHTQSTPACFPINPFIEWKTHTKQGKN